MYILILEGEIIANRKKPSYLCDIVSSMDNVLHYTKVNYYAIMLIYPVTNLSYS